MTLRTRILTSLVLPLFLVFSATAQDAADLNVYPPGEAPSLTDRLHAEAFAALDKRREAYEALETPEDIAAYQAKMKDFFVEQLGGFPERTPLNARVTGGGEGEGFRYEKILYDSRPGFTVSAILYLPDGDGPFPGIIFPCGHSSNGKAAEVYQRACILLAKNGLAVLCYDPIGQGERIQTLDDDGTPVYTNTIDHMMVGIGSILVGRNTATYRIWDGMRGIDYLQSRPEIDGERIGATGNSGGGTLTSYLMALDERIDVAAPSCYLTTFHRLLETIGPQDAEQNIYGQLAFGMDHPDYVIMRAPRPTLMCVATQDFFDIDGAWDNFRQSKRIYGRLGYPERVELVETDDTHGFTTNLRVATTRWMRRWLLDKHDPVVDSDFPIFTDEELQCTPDGQVLLMDGQRSVYDLNAEEAARLAETRTKLKGDALREAVRDTLSVPAWDEIPSPSVEIVASQKIEGGTFEKLRIGVAPNYALPGLLLTPNDTPTGATIYLDPSGKASRFPKVSDFSWRGEATLYIDISGFGELAVESSGVRRYDEHFGAHWKDFYIAYLLGKSMVGIRTEEILTSVKFLRDRFENPDLEITLIPYTAEAALPAIHAHSLERGQINNFKWGTGSHSMPASWTALVSDERPEHQLLNTVHGALRVYDNLELSRITNP